MVFEGIVHSRMRSGEQAEEEMAVEVARGDQTHQWLWRPVEQVLMWSYLKRVSERVVSGLDFRLKRE